MESGPCADSFTRLDPQVGGAIVGGKVDDSLAHGSDSSIHGCVASLVHRLAFIVSYAIDTLIH